MHQRVSPLHRFRKVTAARHSSPLLEPKRSIPPKRVARPLQRLPLRVVLVVPFVLQIVIAVGLTGFLSVRQGQLAIHQLAEELQSRAALRVKQRLDAHLENHELAHRLAQQVIQAEVAGSQELSAIDDHGWTWLSQIHDLQALLYRDQQGTLRGVLRRPGDESSASSLKLVVTDPTHPGRLNQYALDARGQPSSLLSPIAPNQQDEYFLVRLSQKSGWSGAELIDSSGQLVMSYSSSIAASNHYGVLTTVSTLDFLHAFLQTVKLGREGEVFVVDRSGRLIGSSSDLEVYSRRQVRGSMQRGRLKASRSHSELIQATNEQVLAQFGSWQNLQSQQASFVWQGKSTYIQVRPYADVPGVDWLIVLVVPESDFAQQLDANLRNVLLLCSGALIAAIAIGWLTSNWIAQPILRLSRASRNLSLGKWDPPIDETTTVAELEVLARSFNQMAEHLQLSFDQVKTALQASEEKFTKVFRTCPDPITIATLTEGRYLDINDSLTALLGYSRDEMIGKTSTELGIWANLGDREHYVQSLLASGSIRNQEYVFLTRTGDLLTALLSSDIIEIEGEPCIITIAKDISDRRRMELALQDSEAKLSRILNSAIAAISCFRLYPDQQIRYDYVSAGQERIFGYTPDELMSDPQLWRTRIHPDDMQRFESPSFVESLAGRAMLVEYRFRHKDGSERWILDCLTSRWDDLDGCWVVTGVAMDVTELKGGNRDSESMDQVGTGN